MNQMLGRKTEEKGRGWGSLARLPCIPICGVGHAWPLAGGVATLDDDWFIHCTSRHRRLKASSKGFHVDGSLVK